MRGVSGATQVAERVFLPGVWSGGHARTRHQGEADLPRMPPPVQRDGGDHLRQDPHTTSGVVRRGVVRHQPEARRECLGLAARARPEQLPDRMGHVAPISAGDGAPGSRPVERCRGGRRDVRGTEAANRRHPQGCAQLEGPRSQSLGCRGGSGRSAPTQGVRTCALASRRESDHRCALAVRA